MTTPKDTYQVKVNEDGHQFELTETTARDLDISRVDDRNYHILYKNTAYNAELIRTDFQRKSLHLKINGKSFEIKIADSYDQLVAKMGLDVQKSNLAKDIKAPMPGMVLNVAVAVGQNVQQGDGLVILEAMKMENVIKAQGEGIIKSIHVETGTAVDKGQLLVEME